MNNAVFKNLIFAFGLTMSLSNNPIIIIGVAGGTASGKTTLVKKLQEKFSSQITVIAQDDYYLDMSHLPADQKRNLNFDHPDALNFELLIQHLSDLKAGKSVFRRHYDFITLANVAGEALRSTEIIIVDGILIFSVPQLRDLFDVKIFMDTDDDVRLARRLVRDHASYGWTHDAILKSWHATVKPMHHQFVQPSKQCADLIIEGGKNTQMAIDMLSSFIGSLI